MSEARFFQRPAGMARRGSQEHHADADEQWVGFHKTWSEKTGITYQRGPRRGAVLRLDRRPSAAAAMPTGRSASRRASRTASGARSTSARIEELKPRAASRPAGLAAYEGRDPRTQKQYSFENRDMALAPDYEKRFRAEPAAWSWFQAMPRSYRHPAIWWVMSAKQEETRERRLTTLIADSAAGRKIKPLRPTARRLMSAAGCACSSSASATAPAPLPARSRRGPSGSAARCARPSGRRGRGSRPFPGTARRPRPMSPAALADATHLARLDRRPATPIRCSPISPAPSAPRRIFAGSATSPPSASMAIMAAPG